ncbi:hypothetical protein GCM10009845_01430 [Pedococcus bigeumensis]|jgi:hypothetical protein
MLPSPLLGPASYLPLAETLREREVPTLVASVPAGDVMPSAVLDLFGAVAEHHQPTVLVAHSNAGYYAPVLAESLDLPVVFVDAALPATGVGETLLAPAAFAELIATLPLTDGLLPPWPSWWDRSDVAALFPDDEWLDRVTREAPRLPPEYFTTPLPVPSGWEARPAAYLGFGDTYAAELALAEELGWVVRRERGHHLTHLVEPDRVAGLLLELLGGFATLR